MSVFVFGNCEGVVCLWTVVCVHVFNTLWHKERTLGTLRIVPCRDTTFVFYTTAVFIVA